MFNLHNWIMMTYGPWRPDSGFSELGTKGIGWNNYPVTLTLLLLSWEDISWYTSLLTSSIGWSDLPCVYAPHLIKKFLCSDHRQLRSVAVHLHAAAPSTGESQKLKPWRSKDPLQVAPFSGQHSLDCWFVLQTSFIWVYHCCFLEQEF